jgi:hypothetical protein|uniref:Uncharacterized protein n=1 Tax=Siphoviridae sp. ct0eR1 TaxID=2825297 RepID=A0A8S5UH52_9CAUD|nr:MAG TPA: hypothetical protein [Siphoviridae sp. ct0eR1]
MWSASALFGLRSPLLLYWSFTPHAGQCVMPICCALASTCFLNCLCSRVLVLLIVCSLLSLLFSLVFVLGGGASQRQRDERLHRLTLPSLFSSRLSSRRLSSLLVLWVGVRCVVRAQPCEHARNTAHAPLVFWLVLLVACCVPTITRNACCIHRNTASIAYTTHCSLLTITTLTIEH